MNWKTLMQGSFGEIDCNFAVHPLDRDRARRMLISALTEGASWNEFEAAARELLAHRVDSDHVEAQLAALRDVSRYFAR